MTDRKQIYEFVALKAEAEKLRTKISMLLFERDELRLVICKNIETAYMLALGSLKYKTFELRGIAFKKKNRQEKLELSTIEERLDEEFAEFQSQIDEQINKMNKAINHSKEWTLTNAEMKEIKKLYRRIVKILHPDLHTETTPAPI